MLHDGMGDDLESLLARDDGGHWYQGCKSLYKGESEEDDEEVARVDGRLKVLIWPIKLL